MLRHNVKPVTIVSVDGNVVISVLDAVSNLPIERHKVHNLTVDTGLEKIMHLMAYPALSGDGYTPNYIAVGTSSTATTAATTLMGAEVYRKQVTNRYQLSTKSLQYYLYLDTSEANGNTLREVGLFTESSGGVLWARATHTAIVKTASIAVTYEWTFTFGAT